MLLRGLEPSWPHALLAASACCWVCPWAAWGGRPRSATSQCLPCPMEAGVIPGDPEAQAHFFRCRCPRRRGLLKKMLGAARKASEGCGASFQLAGLLIKCIQACWDSRNPGLNAKRGIGAVGSRAPPRLGRLSQICAAWSWCSSRTLLACASPLHSTMQLLRYSIGSRAGRLNGC